MPSHDPADRSQIATMAAYGKWAKEPNRRAATAPARAALEAKFLAEADGDPLRAEALRKLYYLRLARKSAAARRARKQTAKAEQAEAELHALAEADAS